MPIARATLAGLSGVGRRTQRAYETRAGIDVQRNIAVGAAATAEQAQAQGWERGRALFQFYDGLGQQGRPGRTYLAWQLPNSYGRCHRLSPRGRQKRINRELADLFDKGMTGNDPEAIERRYFVSGKQAVQGGTQQDIYWQIDGQSAHSGGLWRVF